MEYIQTLTILASLAGFVWYLRNDTKDDIAKLDRKFEMWRSENQALLKAIYDEMKDFHGRMCAIEERKKMSKGEK